MFSLFAVAQTPNISVSSQNVAEKYAPGFPADVNVLVNSDGAVDQLCKISYEIKRNGEVIENVADYGTISYRVQLTGEEAVTRNITAGSGVITDTVVVEDTEYPIEVFGMSIFDNYECVGRVRPIEFFADFVQTGEYTICIRINDASVEDESYLHTVGTFTDCNEVDNNDVVALQATVGDSISGINVPIVVVPTYVITFTGLEEGNVVTSMAPAKADSVMQGDNYTFAISLAACQGAIASVTVGEDVLVDTDGYYTIENVQDNMEVAVTFETATYTITATAGENGSVSEAQTEVECGDDYSVTFIPANGYQLATVTLDGVETTEGLEGNTFTILNVEANHEVAATFEEITYNGPYMEFVGLNDTYEVGDSIEFGMKMHSNGNVDNLCGVGYKVLYWNTDSTTIVARDLTRYGVFSYGGMVAGVAEYEYQMTSGEIMTNINVEYNNNTYSIGAFTMGMFDNDCIDRESQVDFNMIFTQSGRYQFETTIYTCSNGGDEFGTSFVAENCDGLTHYDRVATTCNNPTAVTVQTVDVTITGNTIHTISASIIGGHGTVEVLNESDEVLPEGTVIVNAGETFRVVFTPEDYYALDTVMVNGFMRYPTSGTAYVVDSVYTINGISENYIITAKFKDVRPYFKVSAEITTAGGTVTPKDTTVVIGSDVTLRILPNAGYHISQLDVDGNIIANYAMETITFTNVQEDHHVTISFFPNSIEDEMFAGLSIYPNPNNGKFSVSCENFEGAVTCQMINVNGAIISEKTVNGESTIDFDNEMSAGTYFLRIIAGDKVATRKIVVE